MALSAPTLFIIDVGHGNSAVLVDTEGAVIIDAGPSGKTLHSFLKQEGITNLSAILISHADSDHIGGLMAIIASEEFTIGKVRVNSDALKGSKIWDDLLYTLSKVDQAGKLDFDVSLSTKNTGHFDQGEVHIEILAPNLYIAGRSPGSSDRKKRPLTSNSVSAVIRMVKGTFPFALFLGDIDNTGLENLLETSQDVSAQLAVFPHHGGKPGKNSDAVSFTKKICEKVQSSVIVFSNGRGTHSTPLKEVIQTIREALPETRIICTQLSENCAAELRIKELAHLTAKFAKGKEKGRCCAGTIIVELGENDIGIRPNENSHRTFVEKAASTPLCLEK